MTWQLTLVVVWIQFAVGAAMILGVTRLALRWIAQPAERVRLIQFMLAAVLVLPLLSALAPFPSWRLRLITRGTVASAPFDDPSNDIATDVTAEYKADSPVNLEASGEPVAPQLDRVSPPDIRDDLQALRAVPPASALSPRPVVGLRSRSIDGWLVLALAIVLAHAAAATYILVQLAIGKARLRRLCQTASDATDSVNRAWQAIAGSRARNARLLVSTEVEAPLVFGWLRPVVVIPHEIAANNDSALACCLAHEWSHIERADLLSWHFVNFTQFVLWYQPAFWALRRELRICQEFLADNRSASGAVGSVEYSELLLGLAKKRRALGIAVALTMFDQPSQLSRRIRMLLEDHVPLSVRCRRPFTCCVLAVSALLATTISAVRVDSIHADVEAVTPVPPTAANAAEPKRANEIEAADPVAATTTQAGERKKDEDPVAHMVSYTELMTLQGQKEPIKVRVFIADDGRKRMEQFGILGTSTTIFDANGFLRTSLIDYTKTAIVRTPNEALGRRSTRSFMEDLGRHPMPSFIEWFQNLRKTSSKPVRELGQKELDGKQVNGIVATQGDSTYRIWTDSATGEPVRIENDSPSNGLTIKLMTDFRLGEKLDESLFSFEVPPGYKLWQTPAVASVPGDKEKPAPEAPADLELAWSREGQWVAVAAIDGQPAIYGIYRLHSVIKLNETGEELATTNIVASAFQVRAANLSGDNDSEFLTFSNSPLTAYTSDEKVLWYYSKDGGLRDVCATDLNHDGFDEVLLSYTGFTGLQVLDHTGKLLWKNASLGNVWTVAAGNLEGDARPEIVAAVGNVHVFDADGKHLRVLDPGFYAETVRVWENPNKDKAAAVIVAAGTDAANKTTVGGLSPDGAAQWSFDAPARVVNAAACRQMPWLALTLANGSVRVVDVVAGKEIAQVDGQGKYADVAWLAPKEGAPLLVVATREALHAYRVPTAQP